MRGGSGKIENFFTAPHQPVGQEIKLIASSLSEPPPLIINGPSLSIEDETTIKQTLLFTFTNLHLSLLNDVFCSRLQMSRVRVSRFHFFSYMASAGRPMDYHTQL